MEREKGISVEEIAAKLSTEMMGLDIAADAPVGGIILALALTAYYGPEALRGPGEVNIDGEGIDVLCARIEGRIRKDREGFAAWLEEQPPEERA